jgi:hypothetical protein
MPYIPCPRCGHCYDTGRGHDCPAGTDPRNETEAHLALEAAAYDRAIATVAGRDARIVAIVEAGERGEAVPIRKPGEPRDRQPIETPMRPEDITPGMRQIGGRWFYSAAWI